MQLLLQLQVSEIYPCLTCLRKASKAEFYEKQVYSLGKNRQSITNCQVTSSVLTVAWDVKPGHFSRFSEQMSKR